MVAGFLAGLAAVGFALVLANNATSAQAQAAGVALIVVTLAGVRSLARRSRRPRLVLTSAVLFGLSASGVLVVLREAFRYAVGGAG